MSHETDEKAVEDDTGETAPWQDWRRRHQQVRAPAQLLVNLEREYRLRFANAPVRGRWGASAMASAMKKWGVAAAASAVLVLVVVVRMVGPQTAPQFSSAVSSTVPSTVPSTAPSKTTRASAEVPPAALRLPELPARTPGREVAGAAREETTARALAVADPFTAAPSTRATKAARPMPLTPVGPSLAALLTARSVPAAPTMPSAPSFSMPSVPALSSLHMPALPPMPRTSAPEPEQFPVRHGDVDRDTGRRTTQGDEIATV